MQYRSFPTIPGLDISTLGFGCMRLPTCGDEPASIDEAAATQLLHDAIEAGVNYVDTAWPYHGGQSEPFVGRALKGGWRERVQLATKLPVWLVKEEADWERLLDAQLGRLATDRVDFYLLHALARERWEIVQRLEGMRALERAKSDGRVAHLGFSFHGTLDEFKEIVDGYDWDFCQIQLNFLDDRYQAGLEGLRYASARNIGVIVMEPLRGGDLASPPPIVQDVWSSSHRPWSPAEWALRWVWHHAEVVTALSGMSSATQLRENLTVAAGAGPLSAQDLERVEKAKAVYRSRKRVPCTTCGYCQPCPNRVAISNVLSLYNDAMFDSKAGPVEDYRHSFLEAGSGADRCNECGECGSKCPQSIPIMDGLRDAHAYLTRPSGAGA